MTDDDRMERAKRIRRMREGRRGDSAESDNQESTDGGESTSDDTSSEQETNASTDEGAGDDHEETVTETGSSDGSESTDDTPLTEGAGEEPSESEWFEDDATVDVSGDEDVTEMTAHDSPAADESATGEQTSDTTRQAEQTSETPDAIDDDDAAAAASSAAAAAAAFESDDDTSTAEQQATADDESDSEDAAASQPNDVDGGLDGADEPTEIEGPAATQPAESGAEEEIRVLEFRLGDEQYCLNIQHVEEIVKEETVTRVPNTPDHVRGVVDLRGQITTILDPKISLGIAETDDEQLIIVFDEETFEDQGHTGWVVDEVRQVMPIKESEVKDSPLDQQAVNGVIERDGQFVIWTEPEVALLED